jgi:pyocin large subunit-like protein
MSWQALKWAAHQGAGSLSANAVLRVYADHATKTGRTFVDSKTIAEELETTKPTVLDAIGRILKCGLMKDTGERVGKTGLVRVFQLKMPRETVKQR